MTGEQGDGGRGLATAVYWSAGDTRLPKTGFLQQGQCDIFPMNE